MTTKQRSLHKCQSQQDIEAAVSLMERASLHYLRIAHEIGARAGLPRFGRSDESTQRDRDYIMRLLEHLQEEFCDQAPDEEWYGEFYELTGEHMQLTEEGWVPADMNTLEYTGCEPAEVLQEVNAPEDQS